MTNTNLIDVIKALQPKERQEMAAFLASNYFNKGKNAPEIERLYQIILEAAPEFAESFLSKERVCLYVFSEANPIPGRLEKNISDLNKLLRRFALTQQYFSESNGSHQQLDWAKWLRVRGLAEDAQKVAIKLKTQKGQEKMESLERYRFEVLIAEEEHEWAIKFNQVKGDLNIPDLIYHTERYHHAFQMEVSNRYLLQQKAAQLPNWEIPETWLQDFHKQSALMQIANSINDILKKEFPSTEEFSGLMTLLRSQEELLSFETIDHFYAYLRNFCTLLINGGNLKFIPLLHEIHKDNLLRGYFFANGAISPNVYLNLVQVAIRAKEFTWANTFSEEYRHRIIGGDKGRFFYRFNMSQCLFAEGKFEESLDYIPDVPSNSHYHHMVRRLELKIYYELNSDLLLYKLDAFRKFIVRTATKTIAANLRTMDINFLNILMQLIQTPKKDKARSALLVRRIEAKKLLADRAWLLEKARELG